MSRWLSRRCPRAPRRGHTSATEAAKCPACRGKGFSQTEAAKVAPVSPALSQAPPGYVDFWGMEEGSDNYAAYEVAAKSPLTSLAVLARLARHPRASVAITALENPSVPYEVLMAEVEDLEADSQRLSSVAGNPGLPGRAIRALALHPDHWVRAGVARNPSADRETLELLARDENSPAYLSLSFNPS